MDRNSKSETLKEYGRGTIGGLIFSLPMLYTMEMWWRGFTADPFYLLFYVFAIYLLLMGYNFYAGMRRDVGLRGVMWDSVEELCLAVLLSLGFLLLIGKVNFNMPTNEILGKVLVESMMVGIGISVGTAQLGKKNPRDSGESGGAKKENEVVKAAVLSICGAVLLASSVAPTTEILKIAVVASELHLFGMVVFSLGLIITIQYFVDFRGTVEEKKSVFEMSLFVTIAYLSALLVSFAFLYFFGRVSGYGFSFVLAEVIVLAIPGALGASAGKLLIANG